MKKMSPIICLTFLLTTFFVAGQQNHFKSYTNRGPFNSQQRSISLLIDQTDTNKWFLGTDGGGLWKSTNAGATWTPLDKLNRSGGKVFDIAQNTNQPANIYYSVPDVSTLGNAVSNAGIYHSSNGGNSFTHLLGSHNFNENLNIYALDVVNNKVFMQSRSGVYQVNADGTTTTIYKGSPYRMKVSPTNSTSEAFLISASDTGNVLFKSDANAAPVETLAVTGAASYGIAFSKSSPKIAYAAVCIGNNVKQVYKSTKFGKPGSWTLVYDRVGQKGFASPVSQEIFWWPSDMKQGATNFDGISVDATNHDKLFISATGVFYSEDGGQSWSSIKNSSLEHSIGDFWPNAFVINPNNNKLVVGHDHGLTEGTHQELFNFAGKVFLPVPSTVVKKGLGINAFTAYVGSVRPNSNDVVVAGQDRGGWLLKGDNTNELYVGGGDVYHIQAGLNTIFTFNKHGSSLLDTYNYSGTFLHFINFGNVESYVGYNATGIDDNEEVIYADDASYTVAGSKLIKISSTGSNYVEGYVTPDHNIITSISTQSAQFLTYFIEWDFGSSVNKLKTYKHATNQVNTIMDLPSSVNEIEVTSTDNDILFAFAHSTNNDILRVDLNNNTTTSVKGNLSNTLTILSLAAVDQNRLYVGTSEGIYSTLNGGTTWHKETVVPTVEYFDLDIRASDNNLFAFTYGQGALQLTPSAILSVDNFVNTNTSVKVYPNPVEKSAPLTINNARPFDVIELYDLQGRKLRSFPNNQQVTVTLTDLPINISGLYLLKLINTKTGKTMSRKTLVK